MGKSAYTYAAWVCGAACGGLVLVVALATLGHQLATPDEKTARREALRFQGRLWSEKPFVLPHEGDEFIRFRAQWKAEFGKPFPDE